MMMNRMLKLACCCAAAWIFSVSGAGGAEEGVRAAVPDAFNYVVGTQTFAPKYQFTKEPWLVETAQAMLDMGSNMIKFGMGRQQAREMRSTATAASLTEQARQDPAIRRVFEMTFAHYLVWASPFSTERRGPFSPARTKADDDAEYHEIYEFTQYLLKTFNGAGKTFYLGHWEGDWLLIGATDPKREPSPERVEAMIRWLNVRQKAVDDARRATPHRGVEVYQYTEVNLVRKGMKGGVTLTNSVLPRADVDYVSYSSYDSLKVGNIGGQMKESLSYIESKMKPKAGITGKRVFIGEYGFPACFHDPAHQAEYTRQVMRAGLEWGCPFILYWEMYNNEVDKEGKQRGFWMIDDKGVKLPVYETHRRFLEKGRKFVGDYKKAQGRAPSAEEFGKAACAWLEETKAETETGSGVAMKK